MRHTQENPPSPWASIPRRAWVALVAVATVLGLLASVGPGGQTAASIGSWLWTNTVVLVLLGLASLSAMLLAVRPKLLPQSTATSPTPEPADATIDGDFELSQEHRAADKQTYEELIALVPRGNIRFLSEHDFGNAWEGDVVRPLFELVETRNEVEHRFFDPELETRRCELHQASEALVMSCAKYGIPAKYASGLYELAGAERRRDEPPEGEHYERHESRRKEINLNADAVVSAYDALVSEARKRMP